MKFYNLLGSDHIIGKIPANVFTDVKLKELLQRFFTEDQVKNIIEVLMQPLSRTGIIQRQELFLELENEDIADFFAELKKALYGLQARFRVYSQQSNSLYKPINFVDLILEYIDFVDSICNSKFIRTTRASLLQDFINSFMEIQTSITFSHLKSEANRIKHELREIKSVDLNIPTPTGSPRGVTIQQSISLSLADELTTIATNIGEADAIPRRFFSNKEFTHKFMLGLSQLYPDLFAELERFHNDYHAAFDLGIFNYINQISFYLDMKQLFTILRECNIPLTMPQIASDKIISINDARDISLLIKLESGKDIIPNDIDFNKHHGFHILAGANSGGKTVYLRAIAICQILFSGGSYIPAIKAEVYPFHNVFTHFPVDESRSDVGRLREEQNRATEILKEVSENSLVLLNETYSSTNEQLSLDLSYELLSKLCQIGAFGLYITHNHKLLEQGRQVTGKTGIGHLSVVVLDDAMSTRTYKIVQQNTHTQSYAWSVLDKYKLTREHLIKRFPGVK